MKKLEAIINDEYECSKIRKDKVTVTADERGVYIKVKGYSCANSDEIIMLENYGGKLRLHIWADIKEEDPSHTIDLEGAKERKVKCI